jgi:hypothetical protein
MPLLAVYCFGNSLNHRASEPRLAVGKLARDLLS